MDRFDPVRKAVYEAALMPSRTPQMMQALIGALDADAASLYVHDLSDDLASNMMLEAWDPICDSLYTAQFANDNPIIKASLPMLESGMVKRIGDLLPERDYLKTRYYNEFCRPFNNRHILGVCVVLERSVMSVLTLVRRHGVDDFTDDHIALMRQINPHMQRAVLVRRELGTRDLASVAAWEALQQSGLALMTLDVRGQASLITESARRLCERGDGLRLASSGLGALDPVADAALQRAQTLARQDGAVIPILSVPRTGGKPYRILVVGIEPVGVLEGGPRVLVMIRAPDLHVSPHAGLLRELFGLTAAEARLVNTLVGGDGLQDHASRSGTRIQTARSQLRSVFDKTDTESQADLCRLIGRAAIGAAD